ncbi:MAG TPA: hypothetical protein H9823_05355 [Candidatus Rubneribacter avistercoris]|nr:hypothetical protein [Candidatus Rubneribacter avistercoris]
MWPEFFQAVVLAVVLLLAPGFLIMRSAGFSRIASMIAAPALSLASYGALAIVLSAIGMPSSLFSLLGCSIILGLVACAVKEFLHRRGIASCEEAAKAFPSLRWRTLVLYIVFSAAVGLVFYVRSLDGTETFVQEYDNAWHLNLIETFVQTGDYSSLYPSVYTDISPLESVSSFYPAAWHGLCAMVSDALGVSAALTESAVNFTFSSMVFPAGVYGLIGCLLGRKSSAIYGGVIVSVAFAAFPWRLILFGPLFPNLASLASLPAVMALFVTFWEKGCTGGRRRALAFPFLWGVCGLALTQPNAVFTAVVFLAPYCVFRAYEEGWRLPGGAVSARAKKAVAAVVCALGIVAVWTALYYAPFMQVTVSFTWEALTSVRQALVNSVVFAYVMPQSQLALGFLVVCGAAYSFKNRSYLWMTISFVAASVLYVFDAGTEGFWKHFFTGFWYTDPYRVAATAVICAIPLACLGFHALIKTMVLVVNAGRERNRDLRIGAAPLVAGMMTFAVLNYYPSYSLPGLFDVDTAFGSFEADAIRAYSEAEVNVLDHDEVEFLNEVEEVVPEGALILNQPHDGSVFAYATNGLNVYYRSFWDKLARETQESKTIRTDIDDIADNDRVRQAVHDLGAEYVLVLDVDGYREERRYLASYDRGFWKGFCGISDSTPGLEAVLSEGDMRLYKIIA